MAVSDSSREGINNGSSGSSAPLFKTTRHAFERANAAGDLLFEVRPGVPAIDAIESASCYLDAALGACSTLGEDADLQEKGGIIWAAYYLVKMAKAAVDASACAVTDSESIATGTANS